MCACYLCTKTVSQVLYNIPYPGNLKHLLKKSNYSQFREGNETSPGLHTALVTELGMQPISLNTAWFSLPRATMSPHHQCYSVSINAAEPQTSFYPRPSPLLRDSCDCHEVIFGFGDSKERCGCS